MSLEAWGDDGDADRPYTQERVDEIVAEETAELAAELERYKRALWAANGFLIQLGQQPVKLEYASSAG